MKKLKVSCYQLVSEEGAKENMMKTEAFAFVEERIEQLKIKKVCIRLGGRKGDLVKDEKGIEHLKTAEP